MALQASRIGIDLNPQGLGINALGCNGSSHARIQKALHPRRAVGILPELFFYGAKRKERPRQ